jgi:hypothetical protein
MTNQLYIDDYYRQKQLKKQAQEAILHFLGFKLPLNHIDIVTSGGGYIFFDIGNVEYGLKEDEHLAIGNKVFYYEER